MPDSSKTTSVARDRFRLMAAQFRALAESAKDPVVADGYRRLAEGYESLAGCHEPAPKQDKS